MLFIITIDTHINLIYNILVCFVGIRAYYTMGKRRLMKIYESRESNGVFLN